LVVLWLAQQLPQQTTQQAQMLAVPVGPWDGLGMLALRVAMCVVGAGLIALSFWVLRGRRDDHAARVQARREELAKLGRTDATKLPEGEARLSTRSALRAMSEPTRLVVGISLLLAGYHLLAYGLPPAAMPFRVPMDRLWMLGVGLVGACGVSVGVDRWVEGDEA
jgi:hypothetical protein